MAISIASFAANASWFNTTNPTAVASWSAGDVIVAFGGAEGSSPPTFSVPTATGLTFSQASLSDANTTQEALAGIWTATAASAGSGVTVTLGYSAGTTEHRGLGLWVVTGGVASIVGQTGTNTESGFSITTTAGDIVIVGIADWNATNPPGKTPATGSGTATERFDTGNGSTYAVWGAEWVNTAAGTFTFGPNNYTNLKVAQVAVRLTPAASSKAGLWLPANRRSAKGLIVR